MLRAGGELGRLAQYERADGRVAERQHRALSQTQARGVLVACVCVRAGTSPCIHSGRDETAQTKSNAHMAESIIMPSEIA